MVAGYWVLADRTERELTPGKSVTIVTVRCAEGDARRVEDLLLASGGTISRTPRRPTPLR